MSVNNQPILIPAGFRFLRGRADVNPLIVNYHVVSEFSLPHIRHLYRYRDPGMFNNDMDFLVSRYKPIGMLELLEAMQGSARLPENAVLITFDDGFREVQEVVAPILSKKGIPATFFITSNLIDNKEMHAGNKKSLLIDRIVGGVPPEKLREVMDLLGQVGIHGEDSEWGIRKIPYLKRGLLDEIAQMLQLDFNAFLVAHKPYLTTHQISHLVESGFTIGGHSIDHAWYRELSLEDQVHQTVASVEVLVKRFSLNYRVFAFPYADYGISRAFFESISGKIDATFGTSGLLTDIIPTNYQRISVEKHSVSAKRTIKFHYARRMVYKIRKKEVITRV